MKLILMKWSASFLSFFVFILPALSKNPHGAAPRDEPSKEFSPAAKKSPSDGIEIPKTQHPYSVRIIVDGGGCSGTLVGFSPPTVVSAGHCFVDPETGNQLSPGEISIEYQDKDMEKPVTLKAKKILASPDIAEFALTQEKVGNEWEKAYAAYQAMGGDKSSVDKNKFIRDELKKKFSDSEIDAVFGLIPPLKIDLAVLTFEGTLPQRVVLPKISKRERGEKESLGIVSFSENLKSETEFEPDGIERKTIGIVLPRKADAHTFTFLSTRGDKKNSTFFNPTLFPGDSGGSVLRLSGKNPILQGLVSSGYQANEQNPKLQINGLKDLGTKESQSFLKEATKKIDADISFEN
jgi:hypothetical protein